MIALGACFLVGFLIGAFLTDRKWKGIRDRHYATRHDSGRTWVE